MSTITLSCLVVGENPYENAFAVEIDTTKLVSFFKDAIKEKKAPEFDTFATDKPNTFPLSQPTNIYI